MTKKFILVCGVAAMVLGAAINVDHASRDYRVQDNSLWAVVVAQENSTGESTGSGNGIHCLGVDCEGTGNCWLEYQCGNSVSQNYDPLDNTYYSHYHYWCGMFLVCDDGYIGYKYNECTVYWPGHYNWLWGQGSCEYCYQNTTCELPFVSNK